MFIDISAIHYPEYSKAIESETCILLLGSDRSSFARTGAGTSTTHD
ncbi:hypothetical protein [Leptolyngbya sp. FACHB-711]|nr:hypothetical protein [Leptolyngbya sp. FACHB-711]MBD1848488.1 hypothetical protein [Cyanobacteria bacterium FACHB-502]MBD2024386.1 hypothetical protein [Leptolyngbya sp. FACHB-711]